MEDDKFLVKLGFNAKLKLDMSSLIVAGHSFGGATALKAGFEDSRIKCILTLDPYLFPIKEDCLNGTLGKNVKKPIFILNSGSFDNVADEEGKVRFESFLAKHKVRENCKFENIVFENGHHFHQNDTSVVRAILFQGVQQRPVGGILHSGIQGGDNVLAVLRVAGVGALHRLPLVAAQILHPSI